MALTFERIRAIHRLVRSGEAAGDPRQLVQAARGLVERPLRSSVARVIRSALPSTSALRFLDVDAVLQRATSLALGKQDVLASIAEVRERAAATKGVVSGPAWGSTYVAAPNATELVLRYEGGRPALFEVESLRGDPLSLEILDSTGKPVCQLSASVAPRQCEWSPTATGDVRIAIRSTADSPGEVLWANN
jgi:hypothetical protein